MSANTLTCSLYTHPHQTLTGFVTIVTNDNAFFFFFHADEDRDDNR